MTSDFACGKKFSNIGAKKMNSLKTLFLASWEKAHTCLKITKPSKTRGGRWRIS